MPTNTTRTHALVARRGIVEGCWPFMDEECDTDRVEGLGESVGPRKALRQQNGSVEPAERCSSIFARLWDSGFE